MMWLTVAVLSCCVMALVSVVLMRLRFMREVQGMQKMMSEACKAFLDAGVQIEQDRILKLLADPEWHEETKDFTRSDSDLSHQPEYCWACQLQAAIKGEFNDIKD